MTPRVKVKVYGLLPLTKRTYLTIQSVGGLIVLTAIGFALFWPRPRPEANQPVPAFVDSVSLFLDLFPFIGALGLFLVGIETWIVLGKFRREEQRQRDLALAAESPPVPNP